MVRISLVRRSCPDSCACSRNTPEAGAGEKRILLSVLHSIKLSTNRPLRINVRPSCLKSFRERDDRSRTSEERWKGESTGNRFNRNTFFCGISDNGIPDRTHAVRSSVSAIHCPHYLPGGILYHRLFSVCFARHEPENSPF